MDIPNVSSFKYSHQYSQTANRALIDEYETFSLKPSYVSSLSNDDEPWSVSDIAGVSRSWTQFAALGFVFDKKTGRIYHPTGAPSTTINRTYRFYVKYEMGSVSIQKEVEIEHRDDD
jgi:hypothetical protein